MSTANLNPELKAQVNNLRGSITAAAERNTLPARFTIKTINDTPSTIITDTETGKTTTVSLYALGEVRKTLNNLFG